MSISSYLTNIEDPEPIVPTPVAENVTPVPKQQENVVATKQQTVEEKVTVTKKKIWIEWIIYLILIIIFGLLYGFFRPLFVVDENENTGETSLGWNWFVFTIGTASFVMAIYLLIKMSFWM